MLTLATWNLENFLRPGVGQRRPDVEAAYEAKLAHLKATIETITPDVLGVREVGQPEALEDLRGALGADWQAIASQHPDGATSASAF